MQLLLAAGADPTAQDAQQRTALHIAAMANDVELVQVIIHFWVHLIYWYCD